jgi:hypothetical protein
MRHERMGSEPVQGLGVVVELSLPCLAINRPKPLDGIGFGDRKIDEEVRVAVGYSSPFIGAMKADGHLRADALCRAVAVAEPLAHPAGDECQDHVV